jgi:hypothetical protein
MIVGGGFPVSSDGEEVSDVKRRRTTNTGG